MSEFENFWNQTLVTLTGGAEITVGQVVPTALFVVAALAAVWWLQRLVVFEDFGDSALIFDVFFWCNAGSERKLRAVRSDVRFRITGFFDEHGIVIAFPQRDVHLYDHTARGDDGAAA